MSPKWEKLLSSIDDYEKKLSSSQEKLREFNLNHTNSIDALDKAYATEKANIEKEKTGKV